MYQQTLQKQIKQQKSIFKRSHSEDEMSSFPCWKFCLKKKPNLSYRSDLCWLALHSAFGSGSQRHIYLQCYRLFLMESVHLFWYESKRDISVIYLPKQLAVIISNVKTEWFTQWKCQTIPMFCLCQGFIFSSMLDTEKNKKASWGTRKLKRKSLKTVLCQHKLKVLVGNLFRNPHCLQWG